LALLGGVTAMLVALSVAGSTAGAQEQPSSGAGSESGSETAAADVAVLHAVDATGDTVEASLLHRGGDLSPAVSITRAGEELSGITTTTASEQGRAAEIVFVLDIANRSMAGGALRQLAESVADAAGGLPEQVEVGLVTAGDRAATATRLGAGAESLGQDLQSLAADEEAAIHDAITIAGRSFSDRPQVAKSIVVVSSGPDTASLKARTVAEGAVVQSGAQIIWVSYNATDPNMAYLVERSGGATLPISELTQAAEILAAATELAADRLLVSFPAQAEAGQRVDATLTVADRALQFSYPEGVNTTSVVQLGPTPAAVEAGESFFANPAVLYVSVGLAFVAIAAAVWALASMFAGGQSTLDTVLARYSERDGSLEDDEVQEMLVQTALIRRAVDITETFAERRGFLTRLEELLERANLPFRAGEGLFFLATITVVLSGLALATTGSVVLAALLGAVSIIAGFAAANFLAGRRLKQFEAQLPDALQLLAGTLRAGYSLPQGLDAVSNEIADPMGQELRRALTEAQLGRELEEALTGIAERLDSEDFAWAVMAIGIQREVGGNLSEVLLTVAETMIQRERLNREVSALTAEGRVSAAILSLLPPGLGAVMWVINPGYLGVLFDRTIGLVLLGVAVLSGLAGLAWMKKVITIDV
jgi:tight adherence protein B